MTTQEKPRHLKLRFWVATFLHGLYCRQRWGQKIMSLYLHNIWIHWPSVFETVDFNLEGTDMYEAWLATAKRIMIHLSNRKQESALLELVIRNCMEGNVSDQTELADRSWRRIEKNFKGYVWKEYIIPHSEVQAAFQEWAFFLKQLALRGFSQSAGDYSVDQIGRTCCISFKTLPLDQ